MRRPQGSAAARLAFLLVSGLACLWLAAAAAAHALLLKSMPENEAVLAQPPRQVTAWFSQELDTHLSALQVVDAGGQPVDNGDGEVDLSDPAHASMQVTLPAALPTGAYRVLWTAVSADDGDTTAGEFSFSVGRADANQVSTPATIPGRARARSLGWLAAGLGLVCLVGLAAALRRRVKAGCWSWR